MRTINSLTHFIHKHFLLILLSAYCLAIIVPGPGLLLRNIVFGQVRLFGSNLALSPSLLMLALMLFNAGLGIQIQEIKHLVSRPQLAIIGLLANSLVPIILVFLLHGLAAPWHNQDEVQNLLTGLALIVSMPIAGSSTAWSQNANGNLSLSLGMVFLSTFLSPITTPLVLHTFSHITVGDYSEDLQELAQHGTHIFMGLTVVIPSLAGMLLHFKLGENKVTSLKPLMKLLNFVLLLLLNYSNAATSLPQAFSKPDFDFLFMIFIVAAILCLFAFGSGWLLSKLFKTDKADMASLMFGLGMNNNGVGIVLAASTLSDHPAVLLPMIFYMLIQQMTAAFIDRKFFQTQDKLTV